MLTFTAMSLNGHIDNTERGRVAFYNVQYIWHLPPSSHPQDRQTNRQTMSLKASDNDRQRMHTNKPPSSHLNHSEAYMFVCLFFFTSVYVYLSVSKGFYMYPLLHPDKISLTLAGPEHFQGDSFTSLHDKQQQQFKIKGGAYCLTS